MFLTSYLIYHHSEFPSIALEYSDDRKKLLVCKIMTGREYRGRDITRPPGYDSKLVNPRHNGVSEMVIIQVNSRRMRNFCYFIFHPDYSGQGADSSLLCDTSSDIIFGCLFCRFFIHSFYCFDDGSTENKSQQYYPLMSRTHNKYLDRLLL